MTERNGHFSPLDESQLDEFLDGTMPREKADAFQRGLDANERLREVVRLQTRIDSSLRTQFCPSEISAAKIQAQSDDRPVGRAGAKTQPRWVGFAAAAVFLLAMLGAWALWFFDGSEPRAPRFSPTPMDRMYATRVSNGFQPDWRCESDDEFRQTFQKHLGSGLTLAEGPGVEMLGLAYGRAISPDTVCVMARVHDNNVIVFVDRLSVDIRPTVPAESGLRLHRVESPPLVFYELTPLEEAKVIPLFSKPLPRACGSHINDTLAESGVESGPRSQ